MKNLSRPTLYTLREFELLFMILATCLPFLLIPVVAGSRDPALKGILTLHVFVMVSSWVVGTLAKREIKKRDNLYLDSIQML